MVEAAIIITSSQWKLHGGTKSSQILCIAETREFLMSFSVTSSYVDRYLWLVNNILIRRGIVLDLRFPLYCSEETGFWSWFAKNVRLVYFTVAAEYVCSYIVVSASSTSSWCMVSLSSTTVRIRPRHARGLRNGKAPLPRTGVVCVCLPRWGTTTRPTTRPLFPCHPPRIQRAIAVYPLSICPDRLVFSRVLIAERVCRE